jgi:hypothetical protein
MNDMAAWTAAMRAERWTAAWAIQSRSLAARDPVTRDDPRLPYHQRWVWDGTPIDGRDVLVRCYHGLGDTIQFARYLPLLASRAASVTVEAQPELVDLLRHQPIAAVPFDRDRPLAPAECDIEITELAFALRTGPDRLAPPYLRAGHAALPRGAIGLCHTTGGWDPARRVPADLLEPICAERPCVALVPGPSPLAVLNPEGCSPDVMATAAIINALDLVVTVDTMVAHLAGALGRPTWLLLKHDPDWRWSPQRGASDWYPTTRLYVQPEPRDWATPLARLRKDLRTISPNTG